MDLPQGQYDIPPTAAAPWEIAERWLDRVAGSGWIPMVACAAGTAIAIALWRRWEAREPERVARVIPWLRRGAIVAAVVAGLGLVWSRRSLVDDAFISFRYADNWAHGRGPVFNPGEAVQGYTDFLWVALLAALTGISGVAPAQWAVVLGPLLFAANVVVVAALGGALAGGRRVFPVAAVLFAVNFVATEYGTTGLETGAASLCVDLGLLALFSRDDAAGAGLAGLAFTLASLLRLDHGLFQLAGLAVVASRSPSLRRISAYLAPGVLIVAWAVWARATYGEVLPNTFAAKVGANWDPFQGALYAELWLLGTHAWIPVSLGLGWAVWRLVSGGDWRERAFAVVLLATAAIWQVWLLRIGGDFMYGRFYLSFLPLFLLAAERACHAVRVGPMAAAVLAASALALRMFDPGHTEWFVADEPGFYPLSQLFPPVVDHHSFRIGELLGESLRRRDLRPVVATSGPGMIAYLSDLTTIDVLGLTDRQVAHGPDLFGNGRPGHSKVATIDYLIERKVRLGHYYPAPEWVDVTALDLGDFPGAKRDWFIVTYEVALMRRMEVVAPEIGFVDFERWLDRYVDHRVARRSQAQVLADLGFIDNYFFKINGPGRWRQPIAEAAGLGAAP